MKRTFLRDDKFLTYEDQGTGPLVVCIPSMGDLKEEYRFLQKHLLQQGYRVVLLDIRGMGESAVGWDTYSVEAMGADLAALIQTLDAGPALVIATSISAAAAVWAAVEAPDWVSHLVLIGAFVRGETSPLMALIYRLLFARPWGPAMWGMYYNKLYPTQKPADFKDYLTRLKGNLQQTGRMESLLKMLPESKSAAEKRTNLVKQPALLLMGTKDPDFKDPKQEVAWAAQVLRGRYHLINDAGHYPHAEMPDIVFPLIDNFVKENPTTGKEVNNGKNGD